LGDLRDRDYGVRVIRIYDLDQYCIVAIISKQQFLDITFDRGKEHLRVIKALIEVLKIIQKKY
jgi:hypothetical protein